MCPCVSGHVWVYPLFAGSIFGWVQTSDKLGHFLRSGVNVQYFSCWQDKWISWFTQNIPGHRVPQILGRVQISDQLGHFWLVGHFCHTISAGQFKFAPILCLPLNRYMLDCSDLWTGCLTRWLNCSLGPLSPDVSFYWPVAFTVKIWPWRIWSLVPKCTLWKQESVLECVLD